MCVRLKQEQEGPHPAARVAMCSPVLLSRVPNHVHTAILQAPHHGQAGGCSCSMATTMSLLWAQVTGVCLEEGGGKV
jgi:hypothetical protein